MAKTSDFLLTKPNAMDAVGKTFNLFGKHFCVFSLINLLHLPLVAMIVVVYTMMVLSSQGMAVESSSSSNRYSHQSQNSGTSSATPTESFSPGIIALLVVLFVLFALLSVVGTGATIRATADVYAGEQPSFGRSWQVGFRNACRLCCFGLMAAVAVTILLIPLVLLDFVLAMAFGSTYYIAALILIPFKLTYIFYFTLPLNIAPPSIVLEPRRVDQIDLFFSRAWTLTENHRCTIFAATIVLTLINLLVSLIPIVGMLWTVFMSTPINIVLATILFLSLRVEKEGFNVCSLRNELGFDEDDATEMVAPNDDADWLPCGDSIDSIDADPVAKAKAILEASKKRKMIKDNNYQKLDVSEAPSLVEKMNGTEMLV